MDTADTAEQNRLILEDIAAGMPLRQSAPRHGLSAQGFEARLHSSQELSEQYAHARRQRVAGMVEDMIAAARDTNRDPNCRRVEVDTLKWVASRMDRINWGDITQLQQLDERGKPTRAPIVVMVDPGAMLHRPGCPEPIIIDAVDAEVVE